MIYHLVQQTVNPTPLHARTGADFFLRPDNPNQRRYEALRAFLLEGLSLQETADRLGYSVNTVASLLRDFRSGHREFFIVPRPGPRSAPAKEAARPNVVKLRRQGLSVYEIATALKDSSTPLNRTGVTEILREEGFARFPPRAQLHPLPTRPQAGCRPPFRSRQERGPRSWPGTLRRPHRHPQDHRHHHLLLPLRAPPPDTFALRSRPGHAPLRAQPRRGVRPRLPRRHALRQRPRPGGALRSPPQPAHRLHPHLLRPGLRHPQHRLRQRGPAQGRPEPGGHRLL